MVKILFGPFVAMRHRVWLGWSKAGSRSLTNFPFKPPSAADPWEKLDAMVSFIKAGEPLPNDLGEWLYKGIQAGKAHTAIRAG